MAEDFPACVGLITHLTGHPLDGFKQWLALKIIESRFDDDRPREHQDPPAFDRSRLPEVDRRVAAFFVRHVPAVGTPVAKAAADQGRN